MELPGSTLAATPFGEGRVLLSHYDDHAVSLVDVGSETVERTAETPVRPFGSLGL